MELVTGEYLRLMLSRFSGTAFILFGLKAGGETPLLWVFASAWKACMIRFSVGSWFSLPAAVGVTEGVGSGMGFGVVSLGPEGVG